ncbi:MAG TPA: DUF937 domain-containing protein [Phaeodactylibacter sp.]|nr:DUF937 domain-containing protein [Phaeodactylibacter sp.]
MSIDFNSLLQGQLSDDLIEQFSQQLGGVEKEKTATAATAIVSTLTAALARNASKPEGAEALANALERDHDGSVLDNIMDFIGGHKEPEPAQSKALDGMGILNHLLGNKQNTAVSMISQLSGLGGEQTNSLMSMLAPVVMGALGRQKRQQGLDVGGLVSLLSGGVSQSKSQNPMLNMAMSFLDSDGDGSIMDDIGGMGVNLLKGFFGKK